METQRRDIDPKARARIEQALETELAEARAAARASRPTTRKGPKRHSASARRAITLKAQATREANRKSRARR